jgi:hypothetical protein
MIDINRFIHKLYTDTTTTTTLSFLLNPIKVYKTLSRWQKIKMRVLAHRFGQVYACGIDCFLGCVGRYPEISHGAFLA